MRIALTAGEPAGIGPDIILQLSQQAREAEIVVYADRVLLAERAQQLGLVVNFVDENHQAAREPGVLAVHAIPLVKPCIAGQLNPGNASYVMETLRQATQACLDGKMHALVTGPIHKGIINQAGISCSGHTEFLAQYTRTKAVVMMLATAQMRVALLTTHLPLRDVPSQVTPERLISTITILHHSLTQQFSLARPRIAVCGLNPHAGENGYLGTEEIEIINPVIRQLRQQGMDVAGAYPADTIFTDKILGKVDAVLAMYHDQGLPVLKYSGFGEAVNITLGLPIIRTSVDHGTALDIAGSGLAYASSLLAAINMAHLMVAKKR